MTDTRTALIQQLCELEWTMFDKVENEGGRASCQQNPDFFKKMRACQFRSWSEELLTSYKTDLEIARDQGMNLPEEKYAYMMEKTHPDVYAKIRDQLPSVSDEALTLINEISRIQLAWEHEVDLAYPHMRANGRPLTSDKDTQWNTSFETYLWGELKTYSLATLRIYAAYVRKCASEGRNLAMEVAANIAADYGYASLEEAERKAEVR